MVKEELIQRLKALLVRHYICDDSYYSCPLSDDEEAGSFREDQDKNKCSFGASARNAKIEELIADLA